MSFLKENKKIIIPASILAIGLVVAISIPSYQIFSNKILVNTYVAGVNIGGLTKEQALKKLENNKKLVDIKLNFDKKTWKIDNSKIDLSIDEKKTVDNAFNYNRSNNVISNFFNTVNSNFGSKNQVPLVKKYDIGKLEAEMATVKNNLDAPVKNATMTFENDKAIIQEEVPGMQMNLKKSLDIAKESIKNDKFKIELDVKLDKAKFTKDDLKGIDTRLASYKTQFGGMAGRDFNIKKSTIDSGEILLKPGQEYSFNDITGEKTIANGYKVAPVIESGKLIPGVGGGVCQTSSTIFNTALLAGMEITVRRSHTIPSDYVDMGRDATVYDGNPGQDFKFKNPFKHPVFIKNYVKGSSIVSEIYGSKEDLQNIAISTEMIGSYGRGGNKVVNDPSLAPGAKVVEKYSRPGYTVVTYRIFKDKNGKVIKTENIGESHYPAQQGLVRVGPGGAKAAGKNSNGIKNTNSNRALKRSSGANI